MLTKVCKLFILELLKTYLRMNSNTKINQISGDSKKKNILKTRNSKFRKKNEFYKSSQTILNTYGEKIPVHCKAHCKKCSIDTLAEHRKVNCQICSSSLVYYCAMCKEQFFSLNSVKNHVIKELDQSSMSSKCSKCYRSHFSTRCSLIKHESNCNTIYRFDKEIKIKIQQEDFQSENFRGNFKNLYQMY